MARALKVFEITTCWQHNRGRYLVAAQSMTEAAKLLGCSVYHVKNYHYILDNNCEKQALALSQPRVVFKQENNKSEFLPRVEKVMPRLDQEVSASLSELSERLKK